VAAPAHAITIRRAAKILGEDEELLWDMAADMEPEHGHLWIYDTDDQQTVVFTHDGMEYLRIPTKSPGHSEMMSPGVPT